MGWGSSIGIATRYWLDGPGIEWPIPVAERYKARVCGRSLAEIAGSNPAGGMDVYVVLYSKENKAKCRPVKSKKQVRTKYRVQENKKVPVGTRFSAPVQSGPRAQPASYTMCTRALSGGVKRTGRAVNHPPPSSTEVKERVELLV